MARLIANLDYLAKGNFGALKRICAVDDEDLADMIRELRAYDPKPGCKFDMARPRRLGGARRVRRPPRHRLGGGAQQRHLPRLLVNRTYYAELSAARRTRSPSLAHRMPGRRQLADEGARPARPHHHQGLDEIVKQQDGFFRHGVSHLRPLTLRTGRRGDRHARIRPSAASRPTNICSCDRGLFELKYFFTSGIQSSDGGDASRPKR
jgi:RNA polymerase sigma-54 factor